MPIPRTHSSAEGALPFVQVFVHQPEGDPHQRAEPVVEVFVHQPEGGHGNL